MSDSVKIIECPRDAMQGIKTFIPTEEKVRYIQALLGCGFDTVDFGSFVSPKAIPQMVDTAEVLEQLDLSDTKSKLLAIVANVRGATDASKYKEIDYLGLRPCKRYSKLRRLLEKKWLPISLWVLVTLMVTHGMLRL